MTGPWAQNRQTQGQTRGEIELYVQQQVEQIVCVFQVQNCAFLNNQC